MEIAKIMEKESSSTIYGLMGNVKLTTNNTNYALIEAYRFKSTVKEYLNSKKASSSLDIVMLNKDYLTKKSSDLSESELKKISLAKALIDNKDYIVLDYFEVGLSTKEKENYKRLLRKLAKDYHKTIIIYTNDITFLWDIASKIITVDAKNHITSISKDKYFLLSRLNNTPEIIKFIDLMRRKNISTEDYQNVLDLLKAIYRIKGD